MLGYIVRKVPPAILQDRRIMLRKLRARIHELGRQRGLEEVSHLFLDNETVLVSKSTSATLSEMSALQRTVQGQMAVRVVLKPHYRLWRS